MPSVLEERALIYTETNLKKPPKLNPNPNPKNETKTNTKKNFKVTYSHFRADFRHVISVFKFQLPRNARQTK